MRAEQQKMSKADIEASSAREQRANARGQYALYFI